jgi:hypothetical protein
MKVDLMNTRNFIFLFLLFFFLVSISILQARVIHVPADSITIQSGINGTVDGDTVLVADGIYTGQGNRDIDFLGRTILVMSEHGSEYTTIDCAGSPSQVHRGFIFSSGEGPGSILRGFTISNVSGGWEGEGNIDADYFSFRVIACAPE